MQARYCISFRFSCGIIARRLSRVCWLAMVMMSGSGSASGQQGASAGGSRADNRRERAQQRAALAARKKPVEQAIQKIERQMESLQARAATLDEQLAAPDAFADRAAATERQRERAQIATELETLENDWLERQAEIEEIERQAAEG